jgi:hypothetical protein
LILLGVCIALAFGIRLALLSKSPGNYDTRSYEEVVGILERGGDLYRDTERYNYSPIWALFLRAAAAVARATGSELRFAVGLLLLLFDGLTAATLYRIASRRHGHRRAVLTGLLFFTNPLSVLVSSWHVQFDGVSIYFLVLAVLFSSRELPQRGAAIASLSASLLVKHVTWFHPLLFAVRRQAGRSALSTALVPYLVFGGSFLPYLPSWREIRAHVFQYRGLRSLSGMDFLLLVPGVPEWLPTALLLGSVAGAVVLLRHIEIARASLLLFLVILVFLPGISRQYFVWPVALGSLFPTAGYFLYTVVAAASFLQLSSPSGVDIGFGPGWYGPWWAAIAWLLLEVRNLRGLRSAEAGGARPAG